MHLVYIQNVIDLMLYALTRDEFLEGAYLSADKQTLSQKEIIELLAHELNAPTPLSLPKWITQMLEKFPYLGWRVRSVARSRTYNTAHSQALGFTHRFAARESLIETVRSFIQEKKVRHA